MMKSIKFFPIVFAAMLMVSSCGNSTCSKKACSNTECTSNCCNSCACESNQKSSKSMKKYAKKYTNADFYTDGKFNQDVAVKAYLDMFDFYGVEYTDLMKKDMWVTDFGLGDFENAGMGGIFWVNDAEHKYFGHEIYLLPNQMIPEHNHSATKGFPAKFESWMVRNGWCYNFSEVGEETPNAPALPESQKSTVRSKNFIVQKTGPVVHLKEEGTFHFLYAGDEGAIVTEFANYHDGAGLGFSNPKAAL